MSEEIKDTITYIGRNYDTHYYIVGSNREQIAFGKKLQRHHTVGRTYPVTITESEKGRLFSTRRSDKHVENTWVTPALVAQWAKENAAAERTARAYREEKALLTDTRKIARQIKDKYRRASHFNRLEIVRVILEELES